MTTDVRELPGARWASQGTRMLAGLYVWLCLWLVAWVLLPALLLPWSPTVITSGSMGPFINRGDIVLSTATALDEVEPGQVVTFHRDADPTEELLTHRVVFIDSDGRMTTRGDANAEADSTLVTSDDLVGRGRLLIPYVGLPILWLRDALPLFLAWVVLTAVAVHLARAGVPKLDGLLDERGYPVLTPGTGLWGPLDRVLGLLEGPPRPPAGPFRAYGPTVATAIALSAFVRTGWQVVVGAVIVIAVLFADPRGPHIPVGRVVAFAANTRAAFTDRMLPRVREQGAMVALVPMLAVVALSVSATTSGAAFTGSVSDGGSQFGSAIWACATPGPQPVAIVEDAWVHEAAPNANMSAGVLQVEGDIPRARAYFQVDVTPPRGCEVASAELVLPVVAGAGERLEVRAVTSAFDASTVTWNTQPSIGNDRVQVRADIGQVTADVTSLLDVSTTGFVVVFRDEDDDGGLDDDDPTGIVQVWSTEAAIPPTMTVDWVFP